MTESELPHELTDGPDGPMPTGAPLAEQAERPMESHVFMTVGAPQSRYEMRERKLTAQGTLWGSYEGMTSTVRASHVVLEHIKACLETGTHVLGPPIDPMTGDVNFERDGVGFYATAKASAQYMHDHPREYPTSRPFH